MKNDDSKKKIYIYIYMYIYLTKKFALKMDIMTDSRNLLRQRQLFLTSIKFCRFNIFL